MFLGGDRVARDKALLKRHGVTHVLNCAGPACNNHHPEDFAYKTLWLSDAPQEDLLCVLYDALDFLEEAMSEARDHRVFVHCQQGVSRSAAVCVAKVMLDRGWTYDESLQHVRKARPVARPNIGFMCQLLQWGKCIQRGVDASARSTTTITANRPPSASCGAAVVYTIGPQNEHAPTNYVAKLAADGSLAALRDCDVHVLITSRAVYRRAPADAAPELLVAAARHEAALRKYEAAPALATVSVLPGGTTIAT